jgi:hypothetical protein
MSYTVTLTIATPCVVNWGTTAPADGTEVAFSTTGALPTGLVVGTSYYVDTPSGNTSNLRTTQQGSTKVNTSGSQSGVHTGTIVIGSAFPNQGILFYQGDQRINVANSPLASTVLISNVVSGCQVRVADGSNNELYNGTATGGVVSFRSYFSGIAYLTVRGVAGGTLYREFSTPFVIDAINGAEVFVNQVIDGTA